MGISERIHEIKELMRKKITDEQLDNCVIKLLRIENEISRNVNKALKDHKHELHFSSGDLRIIATCVNTKMTRFQKRLYFETIDQKFDDSEIINDQVFTDIINQSIADYTFYKRLSDCHYLLGTMTPTVRIIEIMKERENNHANNHN